MLVGMCAKILPLLNLFSSLNKGYDLSSKVWSIINGLGVYEITLLQASLKRRQKKKKTHFIAKLCQKIKIK